MSDDEKSDGFMADRRGLKRAHESPQKNVVLIEGVVPPLRTHVKHGTTIETILHLRIVATLI